MVLQTGLSTAGTICRGGGRSYGCAISHHTTIQLDALSSTVLHSTQLWQWLLSAVRDHVHSLSAVHTWSSVAQSACLSSSLTRSSPYCNRLRNIDRCTHESTALHAANTALRCGCDGHSCGHVGSACSLNLGCKSNEIVQRRASGRDNESIEKQRVNQ